MAMTLKEYLAKAPKLDEAAKKDQAAAEALVDGYYDKLSALIDEHPIGRPTPHGGCH